MKGCVPWIINNYLFIIYIYTLYYKYHVIFYMILYIFISGRNVFPMLSKHQHSLSTRETFFIMPKLVFEVYKLHPRLMALVFQSWEMSLSHLNQGETPFAALPLSQLTLSKIRLTLGPHVIASSILSLYHSLSNHHD
jgi:hypothetical protein